MRTILPRSWKDEFAFAAAAKREELVHKEKLARFDENRHQRKERDAAEDRYDEETWALIEIFLASTESIAEFRLQLDDYDAKTVEALMENREALEAIRSHINELLDEAYVLPDGRRVFKTKDGSHVYDERGVELSIEEIDPAEIADSHPFWETYHAARQTEEALEKQQEKLIDYQNKLDDAREHLDRGGITQDELSRMKTDLTNEMPETVREKLGLRPLQADATLTQEVTAAAAPEAGAPTDVDALKRQIGLGAAPARP